MKKSIRYIIVSALKDETLGLEKFAPVVHTGIGKINACIHTYDAILRFKPELIINYGTAGSLSGLSGLHKIDHFVQGDMDVRGLGFPRGITPFSEDKLPNNDGIVLATADSFITNAKTPLNGLNIIVDLVDMEAFAIGAVCKHHNIKFISYKYVSDNANKDAGDNWKNNVKLGTDLFADLLNSLYKNLI